MEALAALAIVAALALAFQAGRLRERVEIRDEVQDIIGPVRTDVDMLHDRFDRWTKRERRRKAVDDQEAEAEAVTDLDPAVRRAKLRERARANGVL